MSIEVFVTLICVVLLCYLCYLPLLIAEVMMISYLWKRKCYLPTVFPVLLVSGFIFLLAATIVLVRTWRSL